MPDLPISGLPPSPGNATPTLSDLITIVKAGVTSRTDLQGVSTLFGVEPYSPVGSITSLSRVADYTITNVSPKLLTVGFNSDTFNVVLPPTGTGAASPIDQIPNGETIIIFNTGITKNSLVRVGDGAQIADLNPCTVVQVTMRDNSTINGEWEVTAEYNDYEYLITSTIASPLSADYVFDGAMADLTEIAYDNSIYNTALPDLTEVGTPIPGESRKIKNTGNFSFNVVSAGPNSDPYGVVAPGQTMEIMVKDNSDSDGEWVVTSLFPEAGTGTVTSVDVSSNVTGMNFSGGPVTDSGTITMNETFAVGGVLYKRAGGLDADASELYFLEGSKQLGVGNAGVVDGSATFQVGGTTRGSIPIPKMTEAQRDAIVSATAGLQIYNTDTDEINYYDGTAWESVCTLGSTQTISGKKTITSILKLQNGTTTDGLTVGADVGLTTLTDATNKSFQINAPHYTLAEEPIALFSYSSVSTATTLVYGGVSGFNTATSHLFMGAANNTTTTPAVLFDISGENNWVKSTVPFQSTSGEEFASFPVGTGPVTPATYRALGVSTLGSEFPFIAYSAAAGSTSFTGFKSLGTTAAPTVVVADTIINSFTGFGLTATSNYQPAASLNVLADGTPNTAFVPGKLVVNVTNPAGAGENTFAFRSNGLLQSQIANYKDLVAADADMTSKGYVDAAIGANLHQITPGSAIRTGADSAPIATAGGNAYLLFDNNVIDQCRDNFKLPSTFTADADILVTIKWIPDDNSAGDIVYGIDINLTADGAVPGGLATVATTVAAPAVTNEYVTTTFIMNGVALGTLPNQNVNLKFYRDATSVADTYPDDTLVACIMFNEVI